jgi:hypothetical protein
MNLWFEITNVALSGIAGFGLGYMSSRLPNNWWILGYFLPMLLIAVYGVGIHDPSLLASTSALSWMFVGRNKFLVLSFVAAMVLTAPLFRLSQNATEGSSSCSWWWRFLRAPRGHFWHQCSIDTNWSI